MLSSVLFIGLLACDSEEPPEVHPAPPTPLNLWVTGGEISVITVKDEEVEVPGRFGTLSGSFKFEDGTELTGLGGSMNIDLSSWDSDLPERDATVRGTFFDLVNHGTATFSLTEIEGMPDEPLAVGHSAEVNARGWLKMHGAEVAVESKVKLSRAGEKEFHMDSVEPFDLSVEALGMTERLDALMTRCGHKSINDTVKVTLRLSLGPKKMARGGIGKAIKAPGPGGKGKMKAGAKAKKRGGSANRGGSNQGSSQGTATRGNRSQGN